MGVAVSYARGTPALTALCPPRKDTRDAARTKPTTELAGHLRWRRESLLCVTISCFVSQAPTSSCFCMKISGSLQVFLAHKRLPPPPKTTVGS